MPFKKDPFPYLFSVFSLYAFSQISTFLGSLRKAHPSKQINIFVKDFEEFKNLLHIPDFRAIVMQCEQVCTLFNQVFRSQASKTLVSTNMSSSLLCCTGVGWMFTMVFTWIFPGNEQSGKSTSYTALA